MAVRAGKTEAAFSPIVMGMWQAGKDYWVDVHDAESMRAVRAAIDAGITTFDTAEDYGGGHSEAVLGEALEGIRDQVVICSKVSADHLRYDQVLACCEASLRRLRTDYLDLYQIHWPSGSWGSASVPLEETLHALTDLKHMGKIRGIGVSNFSAAQLREAASLTHLDSIQPPYNLFWRHIERDILPWCTAHKVAVLAYSPLAQGILADRFGDPPVFADGDHRHAGKLFDPAHYVRVRTALARLRALAGDLGLSMAQLALAWLIHRQGMHAVVGCRTASQAEHNAAAAEVRLSEETWTLMDDIGREVAAPFGDDPVPWTWQP